MRSAVSGLLALLLFLSVSSLLDALPQSDKPFLPCRHPALSLSPADTAHSFDVLHYDLDLTVDFPQRSISGAARSLSRSEIPSLSEVRLNLKDALQVDSIRVDGVLNSSFTHGQDTLLIPFGASYFQGDSFRVEVFYGGNPTNDGSGGFFFYMAPETIAFSVGVSVSGYPPSMGRYWFPCYDEPYDKATANINVTVPLGYVVASNGLLTSVDTVGMVPEQQAVYHWSESHQISTYLMCIAACRYAVFSDHDTLNDMDITYYVYRADSADAEVSFQNVPAMMEFFSGRFVPYPFSKYAMAEAPVFGGMGAMEHQTCTTYGTYFINGYNNWDYLAAHELAHMWWGDMITYADWREIWISEGFATYCEPLWFEHLSGAQAYHNYMLSLRGPYFSEDRTHRYPIYDPEDLWSSTTYNKGGWVLHMLRGVLGDSTFFEVLRAFADSFAYRNATTEDFEGVCEHVTADTLDWFFDEWIYQAGYPEYQWWWEWHDAGGGQILLRVKIDQVQSRAHNTPIFRMPIPLKVVYFGQSDTTTYTIWDEDSSQYFEFVSSYIPYDVLLDPDDWVLKKATEVAPGVEGNGGEQDPPAMGPRILSCAPNPFASSIDIECSVNPGRPRAQLRIYNLAGQLVRGFAANSPSLSRLLWTWDGRDNAGQRVGPGVYFCSLRTDQGTDTRRLLLVH
jgi:aminopeptidase N